MFDDRVLNGLTVFIAAVEGGSFGRAADAVGLTTSGVSRAIGRLEARMGLRLFDRGHRSLKLTDEGRWFYDQALPLVQGLDRLTSHPDGPDVEVRGHLRVNTDAAFGHYLLAPRLGELLDRHPHLRIDLIVRDRLGDLLSENVDIAVRFGVPDDGLVERRLIVESRVVTCCSPGYVARYGKPGTVEELVGGPFPKIRMADPATGRPYPWHLTLDGIERAYEFDSRLLLNDAGTILSAALAGVGVVRALDFTVAPYLARGELIAVLPEADRLLWPAHVYYPRRTHPSPAIQAFAAFTGRLFKVSAAPIVDWLKSRPTDLKVKP